MGLLYRNEDEIFPKRPARNLAPQRGETPLRDFSWEDRLPVAINVIGARFSSFCVLSYLQWQ
jgi:hypothetical protein